MKLKKLGKYFTKGLQAGVLASALIAGNVSCSQPAGGDTYTPNYPIIDGGNQGGTTTPPVDPTKPTEPTTPTTPTKPGDENEQKYPDYYIDEDFGGQQFVNINERWHEYYGVSQSERNKNFDDRYNMAKEFLGDKVTELQNDLKVNKNSDLYDTINTALQNYNSKRDIYDNIKNNWTALAPVFAGWEKDFNDNKFFSYRNDYYQLAIGAYNQSISNIEPKTFPTNTEFADGELPKPAEAMSNMKKTINTISTNTHTTETIIKKSR